MKGIRIPKHATATEIGRVLKLSERRVRQIADEAKVSRAGRALFPVGPMIRAALELARSERGNPAAREALVSEREAKTRAIELRTAREEMKLVPTGEAVAMVQQIIGAMVSRLNGLPARFTRDLSERRRLEIALDEIRTEVSDQFASATTEYRAMPDTKEKR